MRKVTLANVGQSTKIWLAAADLEHNVKAKKHVLRKGITNISMILFSINIFQPLNIFRKLCTLYVFGRKW